MAVFRLVMAFSELGQIAARLDISSVTRQGKASIEFTIEHLLTTTTCLQPVTFDMRQVSVRVDV